MEDIRTRLTNTSDTERRLKITLPLSRIEKEESKLLNRYSKSVSIDGFRKGKVPLPMVKKMLANSLKEEAIDNVCSELYSKVIKERKIIPLTRAKIQDIKEKDGEMSFVASFEVIPDIEVNYDDISLEVPQITKENVERIIEEMRFSHATYVPIMRLSAFGDYIIIDYDYLKEERGILKPDAVKNFGFVLGTSTVPEEFNRALVRKKIGERVEIKVNYPLDYGDSSVAGRTISYRIIVNEIKEIKMPPLDDEFARICGFESLLALNENVKETLSKKREEEVKEILPGYVISKLVEKHQFDPPKVFVDIAYQDWKDDIKNGKVENINEEEVKKMAVRDAKSKVILSMIAEKEKVSVADEEIKKSLSGSLSREKIKSLFRDEARLEYVREHLKRMKAIDMVVEKTKIVYKKEKTVD